MHSSTNMPIHKEWTVFEHVASKLKQIYFVTTHGFILDGDGLSSAIFSFLVSDFLERISSWLMTRTPFREILNGATVGALGAVVDVATMSTALMASSETAPFLSG